MSAQIQPSRTPASTTEQTDDETLIRRFLDEVASAQLDEWLPARPSRILDLSPQSAHLVALMVSRGHHVVHAESRGGDPDAVRPRIAAPQGALARLATVCGEVRQLDWLADACLDAVVAECGMLSDALAAELTVEDLFRVLRPGGRLLLCVDSLVSGLARLADLGRWAELADVPAADVVLVEEADGRVSRCFWPEELSGMLHSAGFTLEWIRPRTVMSQQTIVNALRGHPGQLSSLVTTEVALSRRRQGESVGAQLIASAMRPLDPNPGQA